MRGVPSLLQQRIGVLPPGKTLTDVGLHPGIQTSFGERCRKLCGALVYSLLQQNGLNMGRSERPERNLLTTERMVNGKASFWLVRRSKSAVAGGSSNVFRSALAAGDVKRSQPSMMTTVSGLCRACNRAGAVRHVYVRSELQRLPG